MEKQIVNPWTWQDELGFVQANKISNAQKMLVCAGQTSVDADGKPQHPEDMRAQMALVLDNIETVLNQAGFKLSDVVRLNVYTTDVDAFFADYDYLTGRLTEANCQYAGTLLGVTRLAFPELMLELEATAMA